MEQQIRFRIGLVNRVVPHDQLLDHAVETAAEIAFNPAESLLAIKRLAWQNLTETNLEEVWKLENKEFAAAATLFPPPETP